MHRYACPCHHGYGRCPHHDENWFLILLSAIIGAILMAANTGCVPAQAHKNAPFKPRPLDACLTVVVDQSGSFQTALEAYAQPLLIELMDQFFIQSAGGESRVVLVQLSGGQRTVLFEGEPADLRARFQSPADLAQFLRQHADPGSSPVYHTVGEALKYAVSLPGIHPQTRLMTVVLSDLADSSYGDHLRIKAGRSMVTSLKTYRDQGGGLAFYCVAPGEVPRWREILRRAEFPTERYVIQSELVARPRLPRFD